jgi:UDP-2,4-diacetamido-2,4,6-trideoxy-beta-L-altropyranose hydrolase
MAERMCLADLSIGAAGSTSWERCCLGLPAVLVILAENQRLIGEALEQGGSVLLLEESYITKQLDKITSRLLDSDTGLRQLSSNAANICDGGGCVRIVATMTGD